MAPGNISTEKNKIFVPLDFSIEPKKLPEFLSKAAKHEKYILIDRRQQYLGLYEWGNFKNTYPISTGTPNSTPLRKFVVNYMDEVHNSSIFDQAPMDHANIFNDYFIHEEISSRISGNPRLYPSVSPACPFSFLSVGQAGNSRGNYRLSLSQPRTCQTRNFSKIPNNYRYHLDNKILPSGGNFQNPFCPRYMPRWRGCLLESWPLHFRYSQKLAPGSFACAILPLL